ncbi:MAG TPA: neutral zinc metallopeptidase [Actinomycetes bacterium]
MNQEAWTHGSAQQRQTWYSTGDRTADLNRCNAVAA